MGADDVVALSVAPGEPSEPAPHAISPPTGWRYVPGLDGIRALAVLAVLAFHAGLRGVGGGLLGVDVFFVLSGFLITSLLVSEYRSSGTISFRAFYGRRARRLLPALGVTIVGVSLYSLLLADPASRAAIRGDALAAMTYVANWRFIFTDQNYFIHTGAPSPLLHTWSLAVEEQFYLVWPALSLLFLRKKGTNALAAAAVMLALGSALACLLLFHSGVGTTRLYYGTDVRLQEVMVGAALAAWWGGTQGAGHLRQGELSPEHRRSRRLLSGAGVLGLVCLLWALHAVDGSGSFLYQGGFLLVALATVLVIASVVHFPKGPVAWLLSLRGLRYIGQISYGLYLYHWPIYLALDSSHSHLHGSALLATRLGVTFAAAALSARYLEEPIRRHEALTNRRLLLALPVVTAVVVAAVVVGTLPGLGRRAAPTQATASLKRQLPAPAASAISSLPVRLAVFGDSMAYRVAQGLSVQSTGWGVEIKDNTDLGCDLLPRTPTRSEGQPPSLPPTTCLAWQNTWPIVLKQENPDVVLIGVGRWEVEDRLVGGRWATIGDQVLQHQIATTLDQAIEVGSCTGAKVILFTLPYTQGSTRAPDGSLWDLNQPWRTDVFNRLVRQAVARHPGVASLIDENKLLDPKGVYTDYVEGIRVRDTDEEHPSVAGGMYLRPFVLPVVRSLGLEHLAQRVAAGQAGPTPNGQGPQLIPGLSSANSS